MRTNRVRWVFGAAAALAIGACNGEVQGPDEADHGTLTTLEGEALIEAFEGDRISPVYEAPAPFVQLALLWDAASPGAIEARWSIDGETWSDWTAPIVHFEEEVAHVGTVVPDAAALHYQLRVPDGVELPTHVAIDPVESLPVEEGEVIAAEDGYDDGDGMAETDVAASEGEIGRASEAISDSGLVVRSRRAWGARAPRCVARHSPNRATIHHTVTPTRDSLSIPARLRQIQSFHMFGRGWCDIAYNYLIARNGTVWMGRGARRIGGHVYNNNTGNVGISFIGTYSSTRLSARQRTNAAKLLRRLHRRFPAIQLNRRDIKGHRQYGAAGGWTECPGNAAYPQLDAIVRLARQ
jgi:hypothetical protein